MKWPFLKYNFVFVFSTAVLFSPTNAIGQNNTPEEPKDIYLGILLSPDLLLPAFFTTNKEYAFVDDVNNESLLNAIAFTGGVSFQRDLSKKVSLLTGLNMCTRVFKYRYTELEYFPFSDSIPPGAPSAVELKPVHYFLEIPLGIKIYVVQKKLRLYINPGVNFEADIFSKDKGSAYYPDGHSEKSNEISWTSDFLKTGLMFSTEIRGGIEYPFKKRFILGIAPGVKYLFNPNSDNLQGTFFSIGINAGLQYSF